MNNEHWETVSTPTKAGIRHSEGVRVSFHPPSRYTDKTGAEKNYSPRLSIRISRDIVDYMKWAPGDRVTLLLGKGEMLGHVRIQKVPPTTKQSWALTSGNSTTAACNVTITVTGDVSSKVVPTTVPHQAYLVKKPLIDPEGISWEVPQAA